MSYNNFFQTQTTIHEQCNYCRKDANMPFVSTNYICVRHLNISSQCPTCLEKAGIRSVLANFSYCPRHNLRSSSYTSYQTGRS